MAEELGKKVAKEYERERELSTSYVLDDVERLIVSAADHVVESITVAICTCQAIYP